MRIFVTGASGFLGSYLVAELLARGHVVGVLLRPTGGAWRLTDVGDRVNVIAGSLDNLTALRDPLRQFEPQVVVHLAWRGVGNLARNSSIQARNIPDTVDLVDLAAQAGAKTFIGAGSQAEYGPYDRAIREDEVPRPTTLYGMAKLAAGSMAGQRCTEHRIRFLWMRIFSMYGPKDADYWLIPSVIRALRSESHLALTRCEQLWGFLHARDAAAGFGVALAREDARGIFNLGSPEAPPLRETVLRLRDMIDASANLGFGEVPYRPDQVMVLKADVSRLSALGWRPEVSLDHGLRETVAWYDATQSH